MSEAPFLVAAFQIGLPLILACCNTPRITDAFSPANSLADSHVTRDKVDVGAANIGANLSNIENHVQKIKSGSGTVLPPSAGWPSAYGGASK